MSQGGKVKEAPYLAALSHRGFDQNGFAVRVVHQHEPCAKRTTPDVNKAVAFVDALFSGCGLKVCRCFVKC